MGQSVIHDQRQWGKEDLTQKLIAFGDIVDKMVDDYLNTLVPNRELRRTRYVMRSGVTTTPFHIRLQRRRAANRRAALSRRRNRP